MLSTKLKYAFYCLLKAKKVVYCKFIKPVTNLTTIFAAQSVIDSPNVDESRQASVQVFVVYMKNLRAMAFCIEWFIDYNSKDHT